MVASFRRKSGLWVPILGGAPADDVQEQLALRRLLKWGEYEPTAATTGVVEGTKLVNYNDPSTDKVSIPAGTYIENSIIYGDVKPLGPVKIVNCLAVGGLSKPTSDTGVFNCTGGLRSGLLELEDVAIIPRVPANGRNGVQGRQYSATRVHVRDTTDGFGVFSTLGANTNADVLIQQSLVSRLLYTYPDPATSNHDDGAHTDDVQYQGGKNVRILGNALYGYAGYESGSKPMPAQYKPWALELGYAPGGCIILQDNTGAGTDASVVADSNWTRGGLAHYNLKASAKGAIVRNGRVYRDTAVRPAGAGGEPHSGYWIRLEKGMAQTDVQGILTHTWVDGPYAGQQLTFASRDRGIIIDV